MEGKGKTHLLLQQEGLKYVHFLQPCISIENNIFNNGAGSMLLRLNLQLVKYMYYIFSSNTEILR